MDLSWIKERLELFIAISGVLTILYKFVLLRCYVWIKTQYTKHTDIQLKIEKIFQEITPNGGGSIKDKVNKLCKDVEINTEMTERIYYRQRWMLETKTEPIFFTDVNGNCEWVNDAYANLFKRDSHYFLKTGWKNCIYEEDRDRVFKEWEECVKEGRVFDSEYRIVNSDGQIIGVSCIATKTYKDGYIGTLNKI